MTTNYIHFNMVMSDIGNNMITSNEETENIEWAGYRFERVAKFKYLGTFITEDKRILEISTRIA